MSTPATIRAQPGPPPSGRSTALLSRFRPPARSLSLPSTTRPPATHDNGLGCASFAFQVQYDGGTSSGGIDLDPAPKTMTINVTAVNDPPVNTVPLAQTTPGNTPLVFSTANGNAISVADVDAGS